MTADSQFEMWDRFIVSWEDRPLWRQITSEISSGLLVMLDRDSHEGCEEASGRPGEPQVRCEFPAILADRVRGRRQCFGHATRSAEFRNLNINQPASGTP